MSSKSTKAQLSLELISTDGKKLKVTSAIRDASEAIGMILARVMPPMVQSVKARLQRGETVQFGGIGLSAVAVTWKKNSIPVSQITKAEILRSNLQIKREGKWLAVISVRSDKVPNVLVFLEVLESLAPQVKSTGVDPLGARALVSFPRYRRKRLRRFLSKPSDVQPMSELCPFRLTELQQLRSFATSGSQNELWLADMRVRFPADAGGRNSSRRRHGAAKALAYDTGVSLRNSYLRSL